MIDGCENPGSTRAAMGLDERDDEFRHIDRVRQHLVALPLPTFPRCLIAEDLGSLRERVSLSGPSVAERIGQSVLAFLLVGVAPPRRRYEDGGRSQRRALACHRRALADIEPCKGEEVMNVLWWAGEPVGLEHSRHRDLGADDDAAEEFEFPVGGFDARDAGS